MKKYKAILFDFDGTLVNTNKFVDDYTKRFIFDNKITASDSRAFRKELETDSSQLEKPVIDLYWRRLRECQPKEIQFFDGAIETLKKLKDKDYKLGLVTTSPKIRLSQILEAKYLAGFFDVEIGEEDVNNVKPHPEPVLKALERLYVDPKDAVFVGNAQEDMESGIAAGVDTIFYIENEIYYGLIREWLEKNNIKTVKSLEEITSQI